MKRVACFHSLLHQVAENGAPKVAPTERQRLLQRTSAREEARTLPQQPGYIHHIKMITTLAAHAIKFHVKDGAEKPIENSSWPLLKDERSEKPGSSAGLQCLSLYSSSWQYLAYCRVTASPPVNKTCLESAGLDPPVS